MEEIELARYEKGEFAFYLPTWWGHVGGEGFVDHFDAEGLGRVTVECLPLLCEGEVDAAVILADRDPGPDEVVGPIVRLSTGFVMQSYRHGDAEVARFRWLHCEVACCLAVGVFGSLRFSGCTSEERLVLPDVAAQVHLLRLCARRTEVVTSDE